MSRNEWQYDQGLSKPLCAGDKGAINTTDSPRSRFSRAAGKVDGAGSVATRTQPETRVVAPDNGEWPDVGALLDRTTIVESVVL